MSASLHVRIPDEMDSDIRELAAKLGYEDISSFIRACLRDKVKQHKSPIDLLSVVDPRGLWDNVEFDANGRPIFTREKGEA